MLRWLKAVGDEVAVGEELVEIETDKANMVYESDAAGTLIEILAPEGDDAADRRADRAGRRARREAGSGGATAALPSGAEPATPAARPPAPTAGAGARARRRRARDATAARRPPLRRSGSSRCRASGSRPRRSPGGSLASAGSTLHALSGSGPGGRIVKADVEAALAAGVARLAAPPAAATGRCRPPPRGRARREARDGQGAGRGGRAHQAPADRGPADGGVEGDRAALLPADRDRHDARAVEAGRSSRRSAAEGERGARPSTTWSSRRARWPCASSRAPTAPTATGKLRALLADQRRRRGRRAGRAGRADRLRRRPQGPARDRRPRRGRWRHGSATGRSRRPSSPAAPSRSPTWGCTGSPTSTR